MTPTQPSDTPPSMGVEVIPQIKEGATVYVPAFYMNGDLITVANNGVTVTCPSYDEAFEEATAAIMDIERIWAATGCIPCQPAESPAPPIASPSPTVKAPVALLVAAKPADTLLVLATFPRSRKGRPASGPRN